ncbi:MAG: transcription termination/antitermination protein NusG [Synechococcaceae cyanobacterium SM2_3_1]|nr:transcription termination/antitermination protein NusG [Synechococcaceae cyanobacterium SM2_3_1]
MDLDQDLYQAEEEHRGRDQDEASRQPPRWYIVQVASGCENKVQSTLMQRAAALDVQEQILEVVIPKRTGFKLDKAGKRQGTEEKIFPGYVLVRMALTDDSWLVVKSTPNVINFVGTEETRRYGRGRGHVKPKPLSHSEVQRIFSSAEVEEAPLKIDMAPGDKIEVLSGPFQGFHGEVVEVSPERSKLKALISIFGRDTPVELEFGQVRKEG